MFQSKLKLCLEYLLIVHLVAEKIIEKKQGRVILNLLVAAGKACATELHNLFTFFNILHSRLAMLCHENICEELETNSNIVLSNFIVRIFHVLC